MKRRKFNFWGWLWILMGVSYFFIPMIGTFAFSLRARKGVLSLLAECETDELFRS